MAPVEPAPESRPPSAQLVGFRAKQLLLLASDLVQDLIDPAEDGTASVGRLVDAAVLPVCYRRRYDGRFVEHFCNSVEQTRNVLLSDIPFVGNTLAELAAHAIFNEAYRLLSSGPEEVRALSARLDRSLAEYLLENREAIGGELDTLFDATIQDADVIALFDVPADQEPDEHLTSAGVGHDSSLVHFENWLVPFGGAPRPYLTYDGRVWPSE
jgi:hypothetical protein